MLSRKAKIVFVSALSGAVVLGIFSRSITVIIALLNEKPTNLSLWGYTEVTFVGTMLGVFGGIILLGIKKYIQPGIYRGIILGIILYAGSIMFGMMNRQLTLGENPDALITLVSIGGVYAFYGIITEWLLTRVHYEH